MERSDYSRPPGEECKLMRLMSEANGTKIHRYGLEANSISVEEPISYSPIGTPPRFLRVGRLGDWMNSLARFCSDADSLVGTGWDHMLRMTGDPAIHPVPPNPQETQGSSRNLFAISLPDGTNANRSGESTNPRLHQPKRQRFISAL